MRKIVNFPGTKLERGRVAARCAEQVYHPPCVPDTITMGTMNRVEAIKVAKESVSHLFPFGDRPEWFYNVYDTKGGPLWQSAPFPLKEANRCRRQALLTIARISMGKGVRSISPGPWTQQI